MIPLLVAIGIIILVIVLCYFHKNKNATTQTTKSKSTSVSKSGSDNSEGLKTKDKIKQNYNYENKDDDSSLENKTTSEYYKSVGNDEENMDSNDWSQIQKASALDDKVYDNHNKFLYDAKKKGVIRTSYPRYYDQHVPEPVVEWRGFYRPQKVPIRNNAKEIPDVDTSSYANRRTFDINTGW